MDDAPPTTALNPPVGPALAALLLGVAHVRRHHGPSTSVEPMVALNVLRELDVLLAHAIEEAAAVAGLPRPKRRSSTRSKLRKLPTYIADAHEDAAHAAVDLVRHGLMRQQRAASSPAAHRSSDVADLTASAALSAGIASKLGSLECRR